MLEIGNLKPCERVATIGAIHHAATTGPHTCNLIVIMQTSTPFTFERIIQLRVTITDGCTHITFAVSILLLLLLLPVRKALECLVNIAFLTVLRHTGDHQAITKYGWSALPGQ